MGRDEQQWLARSVADRKILIIAIEEGHISEVLPESFVINKAGRQQDFPALDLATARHALRRLFESGLVGTYLLNSDDEYLGDAASSSVQGDTVWTTPASGGLCIFLTAAGEQAVGIGHVGPVEGER